MTIKRADPLPYRGKTIIRTIGTILLTASSLMLILGLTVWSERLQGPRFVLYWSWCFLITTTSICVAVLDMLMIRRVGRQTRRDLFRQQFQRKD